MNLSLLAQDVSLSLSPVGGYLLVGVVGAALVTLLVAVPPRLKHRGRFRRATLTGLRTTAFVLIVLAMLRPAVVHTEIAKQSATLAVLVDDSRSMLVADAVANNRRWDAMRSSLEAAWPTLQELAGDLDVRIYAFDESAREIGLAEGAAALGSEPEGEQTAIGSVLGDLLASRGGKRLAGIVLLSDGAQRAYAPRDVPPQVAARQLADLGYKLHTVPFGKARGLDQARDVAVEELLVNETVFVKNPLDIQATLRADGFVNQEVAVQLLVESPDGSMQPAGGARPTSERDGERVPVDLQYTPETAGEFKLTLQAAPQPGEMVTSNNEMSTFVTVLKGGLNVLYLNGALLPEQLYLRRSLDASPDIKVDYFWIRSDRPDTKPPDLIERFEPGKYDVYMIADVHSTAFSTEELEHLAAAVDRGAGLIMLGGMYSHGAGGYGRSPLADVFPIEIDRFEWQDLNAPPREDLHLSGKLPMVPTRLGEAQSLMRLAAPAENAAAWAQLPPLEGANRFHGVKNGGLVLAETPAGQPLLVAGNYGNGRVLSFAGDSTWRWWMGGHERAHKRFWRQTVLWLARKDQLQESRVWVELEARRYSPNSEVRFSLGANSPEGEPVEDAAFEVHVVAPDGTRTQVRPRRQRDEVLGSYLEARAAGDYTIEVTATAAGVELGSTRSRFLVYEQDLELDNPASDRGALEALSRITGGETVPPERLPELLEQIREESRALDVETVTKTNLWDTWPFFLLFALALSTEWYLRKRWQLV